MPFFSPQSARYTAAAACVFVLSCAAKPPLDSRIIEEEQFTLVIPKTWRASTDAHNEQCKLLHDAKDRDQPFELRICLVMEGPSFVASEHGFFFDEKSWTYAGSMDIQPAEFSVASNGVRLTGIASCGITDEAGFHSAGGKCLTSIFFGEKYSVVFETDGSTTDFSEVRKIVNSAVLTKPGTIGAIKAQLEPTDTAN